MTRFQNKIVKLIGNFLKIISMLRAYVPQKITFAKKQENHN